MKKIILLFLIYAVQLFAAKPKITGGEYFYDIDPGFGIAYSFDVADSTEITANLNLNVDTLKEGFHFFNVRMKDSTGAWSLTNSMFFYKFSKERQKVPIVKGEYFYDVDPGFGSGISFNVTSSIDISTDLFINVDTLSQGFHFFNVRMMDSVGGWSLTNAGFFYKYSRMKNPPPIVYAEYYIDTDPGYKMGTQLSITQAQDITILQDMKIEKMNLGNHKYFVRVQDSMGIWSFINYGDFLVKESPIRQLVVNGGSSEICPNTALTLNFITDMKFNAGNIFTAQLSDENGLFATTQNIGTFAGDTTGVMPIVMPSNFTNSNKYRVRIVSSDPVLNSNESAVDLNLVQPYINISAVSKSTFNRGDSIYVDYLSNCFNNGNKFTLQLSDTAGNFTSPISLGTLTQSTSGKIGGKIPDGLAGSSNYKLRITGDTPTTIGSTYSNEITILGPPVLDTIKILNYSSVYLKSECNIISDGASAITARGVCWNTTGTPTVNDDTTSDGTGVGIFQSTATGLIRNTKYYVRGYAANVIGTVYTNEVEFTTPDVEEFKIPLSTAWNLISTYIKPQLPDSMNNVMSEIKSNLLIAKNNGGQVYIPSYNINTIVKWNVTQGYLVYMTAKDTLTIIGNAVLPSETPIALTAGWNTIGYLRSSELVASTAFASITDNNNLLIAKTLDGNVYIPSYNINTLGNLKPGVGYKVYVITSDTLVYPGN